MDTGLTNTLFQPQKQTKNRKISLITGQYQNVDKNQSKIAGNIMVEAESRRIRKNLTMFSTGGEDMKPLLGIDWPREYKRRIRNIENKTLITDQSEKNEQFLTFEKLIKTN